MSQMLSTGISRTARPAPGGPFAEARAPLSPAATPAPSWPPAASAPARDQVQSSLKHATGRITSPHSPLKACKLFWSDVRKAAKLARAKALESTSAGEHARARVPNAGNARAHCEWANGPPANVIPANAGMPAVANALHIL
eukprot:6191717-Pleurochrysis_carterae.AAC.9